MRKSKYIPISPEQRDAANQVNLYEFLTRRGETLKPHGGSYKLVYTEGGQTHDSIVIKGSEWYDHKNQVGGGAIKFMQNYYDMSYPEAVMTLLGGQGQITHGRTPTQSAPPVKEVKPFELPPKNKDMERVFAYLTKTRHITGNIVSHFAHAHKLYESLEHYTDKETGEQKEVHNAVFVGQDKNGNPCQANERSINTYGKSFRMTVGGSKTNYSFSHFGTSERIYVFEAPIDMMSFISLYPADWQKHSYIALDGISEKSLMQALRDYPQLTYIVLCTDNDTGGIDAAERIRDILADKGCKHIGRALPYNNDWNEDLKEAYGDEYKPAAAHPYKTAVEAVVNGLSAQQDALSPGIKELFYAGQYKELANVALNDCVTTLKLEDADMDYQKMFDKLCGRINRQFRAYCEKGKLMSKTDKLEVLVKGTYKVSNDDSCKSIAKRFYDIAESAVKIEAQLNMSAEAAAQTVVSEQAVQISI